MSKLHRVECCACEYALRMTGTNLERGLPGCVCGGRLLPADIGVAVQYGLMDLTELSRRERTKLCHRMGWEDAIVRTSRSQEPGSRRRRRVRVPAMPF